MDLTLAIVASLIGSGWYLNKDGKTDRETTTIRKKVDREEKSSGKNIYHSKHSKLVEEETQEMANKHFEKSKDPENTGVIPQFFNSINSKKDSTPTTKVSFKKPESNVDKSRDENINKEKENCQLNNLGFLGNNDDSYASWNNSSDFAPDEYRLTGGWKNINTENKEGFTHNNMVPFFGGSLKQNTVDDANESKLEAFNGRSATYIEKKEQEKLFKPEKNLGNVFGTKTDIDSDKKYYVPSLYKQGVPLSEPIRVGAGVNVSADKSAADGFHPMYRPPQKNVNELRVSNNPKVSYAGRKNPKKAHITKRGIEGQVVQYIKPVIREQNKDHYLKTTGAYLKQKVQPKTILKETNRKITKQYSGAAISKSTKIRTLEEQPKVQETHKQNLGQYGYRNIESNGTDMRQNDYGKNSIRLPNTNRDTTGKRKYISNVSNYKKEVVRSTDKARPTRKSDTIINTRKFGTYASAQKNRQYFNPDEKLKITNKQLATEKGKNYMPSGAKPQGLSGKGYTIANVVAPYTSKQDLCDNEYKGSAKIQGPGEEQSRVSVNNMEISDNKQDSAIGREPTKSGLKSFVGGKDVNLEVKKLDCDRKSIHNTNDLLRDRNDTSKRSDLNLTACKNQLPQEDTRLDAVAVEQFKKNPYTQSLHSY